MNSYPQDVFALNEDSKALEMVESCLMDALDAMNRLDSGQHKKKAAELENRIGMFHITKMFALENTNHKMDEHDEANFRERALEWVTRAHESYKKLEDQLGKYKSEIVSKLSPCFDCLQKS